MVNAKGGSKGPFLSDASESGAGPREKMAIAPECPAQAPSAPHNRTKVRTTRKARRSGRLTTQNFMMGLISTVPTGQIAHGGHIGTLNPGNAERMAPHGRAKVPQNRLLTKLSAPSY